MEQEQTKWTKRVTKTEEVIRVGPDKVPKTHVLQKTTVTEVPLTIKPLIQPAASTKIVYNHAPYIHHPINHGVVISDVQFGYLRDTVTGALEPIHDPLALDVARQIVSAVRPRSLYYIGDFMDWPTFSRWQKYPEFYGVLQPSVDDGHEELAAIQAAAGRQCVEKIMIGSNHLLRLHKFILDYNMDALGLRRAKTTPDSWPVFSEQYLLRYDDLGIQFSGQYPGGLFYITPSLALNHAPTNKLEIAADVIHGHTHKVERTCWTQHSNDGRKSYYLYDCGCLCQTGQNANARRLMQTRVPSDRARTTFAQGLVVTNVLPTKIPKHSVDQVSFDEDHVAIYQNHVFQPRGQNYDASANQTPQAPEVG